MFQGWFLLIVIIASMMQTLHPNSGRREVKQADLDLNEGRGECVAETGSYVLCVLPLLASHSHPVCHNLPQCSCTISVFPSDSIIVQAWIKTSTSKTKTICIRHVYTYIYIYIYIERERERGREKDNIKKDNGDMSQSVLPGMSRDKSCRHLTNPVMCCSRHVVRESQGQFVPYATRTTLNMRCTHTFL